MAKKKTGAKDPKWEQIGKSIGKKIEKEFKNNNCAPWKNMECHTEKNDCGGFFGRLLFIIGVLIVLSHLGYLDGISIWVKILIGAGFAFMRF